MCKWSGQRTSNRGKGGRNVRKEKKKTLCSAVKQHPMLAFHSILGRVDSNAYKQEKKQLSASFPVAFVFFFFGLLWVLKVLLHTNQGEKKWTFDHIQLHLYVNSSCSNSDPSCNDMTLALCFSPLKLRQIPVCVCSFVRESITPRACVMCSCSLHTLSGLVDCLSCFISELLFR